MATAYIMCGLPFSGKTTLSKATAEYLGIPRISFDETWLEIEREGGPIPGADSIEQWKYICKVCEEKAKHFLEQGASIVYDNLGSTLGQRNHIRDLAQEAKAEAKVIYVGVTKDEVTGRRERNLAFKERAQVSDENFDNALRQFEPPTETEDYLAYKPEQEIKVWLEKEFGKSSRTERGE